MNNLLKILIKKAKGVSLSKLEKTDGRQRLLAHIRGTAAIAAQPARSGMFIRFMRPVLIGVLALSVAGGGVSFAAENALPGDALYPIKVNVNEEVHAALLTTPEAKADWEATRAVRRLEEAETLAAKGDLSDQQQEQIETKFEEHAQKSEAGIAALETGSSTVAAEISSRLEGSLNAHSRILEKLSMKEAKIAAVAEKVKSRAKQVMLTRADAEAKLEGESAPAAPVMFTAKMASVASATPGTFDQTAHQDAQLKVEAFKQEQKKKRDADEVRILMRARQELKVDVATDTQSDDDGSSTQATGMDTPGQTLPVVKVRAIDDTRLKIGL